MSYQDFISMSTSDLLLTLLVRLIITAVAYLLIPVILVVIGKQYEKKTIRKIGFINAFVVYILFMILHSASGDGNASLVAFGLWGGLGSFLLEKKCLAEEYDDMVGYDPVYPQNDWSAPKNQEALSKGATIKARKKPILLIVISIFLVIAIAAVVFSNQSTDGITYDEYYVGVRTISLDDEFTAEFIYSLWKQGVATEESMIALMDEYAPSQGGGQLYMIEPGDFVEEIDEWCFDRNRKIGDVAIIKNYYGYSICYFSTVKEK